MDESRRVQHPEAERRPCAGHAVTTPVIKGVVHPDLVGEGTNLDLD